MSRTDGPRLRPVVPFPAGEIRHRLFPDARGHFFTQGWINGQLVKFKVDTGATHVGMSGKVARRLGIDYYKDGRETTAVTATGTVPSWIVNLATVRIGNVTVNDITASVIPNGGGNIR